GLRPRTRGELLDRRQRNHLAADLREALRAAADPHEAFGVDRHDVPGVVPAFAAAGARRNELSRSLGQEMTLHHGRAAHDEAAAFVDAVDVLEMPLDARQEFAYRAAAVLHRAVHREHGARLRRAVAFEDANSEFLGPHLSRIVLQLLRAR